MENEQLYDLMKSPNFDRFYDKFRKIHEEAMLWLPDIIKGTHADYVKKVSRNAVSVQYLTTLISLCVSPEIKSVADLGSGLTTYILSWYQYRFKNSLKIYTFDDNLKWLEKTKEYVGPNNNIEYMVWPPHLDFMVDLVSMDLGKTADRPAYMIPAFGIAKKLILLDDMHKTVIRRSAHRALQSMVDDWKLPFGMISLRDYTEDEFGRYANLAWVEW